MSASNLNGYTINWLRGEISTPTSVTSVEPKLLAVLKILVDANGEIVNQDTLMQQVWPNTVVTTNTLQRCIAQLRKLLNDDAKKQQVIKTHPKRGYSVLSSVNNEHAKPKKKPTKLRWLTWLTIGVVTSFAFLFHFFAQGPVIPSLNNIQPINTGAGKLLSASSSGVNQPLAYVRSTDKNQQLIWQQWASQKEQILLEKKRFYGALNFSSDNTKLYFSELEFTGDSKCASLFSYDLNKHNTTPLLKCQNSFIHSGIDISDSQLMYLDTQKNGSSQIKIFSFDKSKTIATQSQSITNFAWHTESKQLAYVDNNHLLTTLTLDADANILSTKHTDLTEIIGVTNKTLSVDWYSSDTILVSHENALYWISSGELKSTQVLLNSNYIKSFSVDSSTQITALLNRENWDSHLRQLNDGQFQTIEKSAFQEINGQFQPSYHQVSFLSDRAGSLNVWLQNKVTVQQITTHSTDVDDYLWKDKSTLWFIANGKLWQQATTGAKQEYPFPHKIIQLFQSQDDQLLVLAETDKGMQLLELDTHTNTSRIVRAENTPWAQKVANNHYIVASTAGQLLRLNQGEVSVIDVLKNLTLQSKFLWRNNQIVFQDKKLNLWQFNPHSNLANIIGKYDINSLFMSDYLAEQELLLSDNKVNVRTELVRLSAK